MIRGDETPPTREQRAWREYLDWTCGAIPSQYELTEQRAWERLERDLPDVAVLSFDADEMIPSYQGEGRIENPRRAEGSEGQWQRWSEGWEEEEAGSL